MLSVPSSQFLHAPSAGLSRSASCPDITVDTFTRIAAQPQLSLQLLQLAARAKAAAFNVRRGITEPDRTQARVEPMQAGRKKLADYGTLGLTAGLRHCKRHSMAGHRVRAGLHTVGFVAAEAVCMLTGGTAPLLALGGFYGCQRVAGAPFLKARTDGGVREDMILRELEAWQVELQAPPTSKGDATRPTLLQAAASVTWAEDQISRYVSQHPDMRVRCSAELLAALERLHGAAGGFVKALVRLASP